MQYIIPADMDNPFEWLFNQPSQITVKSVENNKYKARERHIFNDIGGWVLKIQHPCQGEMHITPVHVKLHIGRYYVIALDTEGTPLTFIAKNNDTVVSFKAGHNSIERFNILERRPISMEKYIPCVTYDVEPTCTVLYQDRYRSINHGYITKITVNGIGTIIQVYMENLSIEILSNVVDSCEFRHKQGHPQLWPTLNRMTPVFVTKWRTLYNKAWDKIRMERKMHPRGVFMQKYVDSMDL